jgi:threonine dehydrogenase-like Zn-dependent dehydrogenase
MSNLAMYAKPSTFSYIGRNAAALRFLLGKKESPEVLIIGPGPLEPFLAAACAPKGRIVLVDRSPEVARLIKKIAEEGATFDEIAAQCQNISDDGTPRRNSDLLDPQLRARGIRELVMAGFDQAGFVDETRYLGGRINSDRFELHITSIEGFDTSKKFDVLFAGTVLSNIRKVMDEGQFSTLLQKLREMLTPNGVLGVVETPAAVSGAKQLISNILAAGFEMNGLVVDNLVNASGAIRGGIYLQFGREAMVSNFVADMNSIRADPLLGPKLNAMTADHVNPWQAGSLTPAFDGNFLPVYVGRSKHGYTVATATVQGLLETMPKDRHTFDFLLR